MSKLTTVIFDMDDVLVDLLEYWVYWLNRAYRLSVKKEDITDWDITQFFPSLTSKQIFEPLESPAFWYQVRPKPNVKETLSDLVGSGYNVKVATASSLKTIQSKIENCLLRLYNVILPEDVILIQDKSLLRGEFLIDDNPENLKHFKGIRILMDSPHNQDPSKYSFDYRIKDISEVIDIIKYSGF